MLIVVAEDNQQEAGQLAQWLVSLGHQATFTSDGVAAIEACQSIRPAAALIALLIPGLDGFEVARRLKGLVPRLVAITSWRNPAAEDVGRSVGFTRFLRKPYTLSDLGAVLAPPDGP